MMRTDEPAPAEWSGLLFEITRQFASSLELDEVLGKVLELTVQSLAAAKGSIFFLDDAGAVQRSILARANLPPEVKVTAVAKVMTSGFAGWVRQHGKGGIITDTESDQRWHFFPDDTLITRSALGVPLIRRGRTIGLMTLMHPEPSHFNQRQLELLEIIAAQAASAIENARMYTETNLQRQKLETAIGGVQDIIVFTSQHEHRLLLFNAAAQRALGLSAADVGRPVCDVVTEPGVVALYRPAEGDSGRPQEEVELKDGRVFSSSLAQIPGVGTVLGLHDVTPFKQLDDMKSEFVWHVSHDLKTPLGVIQGYAWLLGQTAGLSEEARSYADEIQGAIQRMLHLINSLLDLGKMEMGPEAGFTLLQMSSVIQRAQQSVRTVAANKEVKLVVQLATPEPIIRGLPVRLEQAMSNLLSNAIKFAPQQGRVEVSLVQQDDQCLVRVTDNGPGIPTAMQDKLFQKFSKLGQRATRGQEGHGLGLAIVKTIVDAHGGRVWVESQGTGGCTFCVAFPVYRAEGVAAG